MSFLLNSEIARIAGLSFLVSGAACFFSTLLGLPAALLLALSEFRLKRLVITILNSFLSIPAVLIGLLVYLLVNRRGPLGALGLLYTPGAMVLAQGLLALPIVTALSHTGIVGVPRKIIETGLTLGASRVQLVGLIFKEARFPLMAAIIVGFSRIVGETGMTMMVGGNIQGETRVMTTAIALETMKGNFQLAVKLGVILLSVAVLLNIGLQIIQGRAQKG